MAEPAGPPSAAAAASTAAAAFVAARLVLGGAAAPRRTARRLALRPRLAALPRRVPFPCRGRAARLPRTAPVAAAGSPAAAGPAGGGWTSPTGYEGCAGGVGGAPSAAAPTAPATATAAATAAAAAAAADAAPAAGARAAAQAAPPAGTTAAAVATTATAAAAAAAPAGTFDYVNQWYPIFYVRDLDAAVATPFWLLGHPLVVWWAGGAGGPRAAGGRGDADAGGCGWSVLADVCPHRGAPLSEGRVLPAVGDKPAAIACGYHGWEFNGCGGCVGIPQRPPSPSGGLPRAASVSRTYATKVVAGRLWVFGGDAATAAIAPPPYIPYDFQNREATSFRDVVRILPYDPTTLVENVLDPAHVQVAHHGTDQGRRSMAVPIKFRFVPVDAATMDGGPDGWTSTHADAAGAGQFVPLNLDAERVWAEAVASGAGRGGGGGGGGGIAANPSGAFGAHYYPTTAAAASPMSRISFRPPFTVVYQMRVVPPPPTRGGGLPPKVRSLCLWISGVPSRPGETRLVIAMNVPRMTGWKGFLFRLRPAVLSHQAVNVVLDGDNAMLAGQEQRVAAAGGWRAAYHLVAGEADALVLRYRQWLDREGGAIPWAPLAPAGGLLAADTLVGLGGRPLSPAEVAVDRYNTHVRDCVICRTAVARLVAARVVVAVLAAAAAAVAVTGVAAPAAAVQPAMAAVSAVVAAVGGWGVAALGVAVRRFGATDVAKRLAHKD